MKYSTNPLLILPQDKLLSLASGNDSDAYYGKEMLEMRTWAFILSTDPSARKLVHVTKPPLEDPSKTYP